MFSRNSNLILAVLVIGLCALFGVAQTGMAKPREVDQKEYALGESDARSDLKQGRIVYVIVGQPSMIDQELKKIALEEYGITVKFHGCAKGPRVDYDQGYLDTVIVHLKKKHSFNPILKIERDLRVKSRESIPSGNDKLPN